MSLNQGGFLLFYTRPGRLSSPILAVNSGVFSRLVSLAKGFQLALRDYVKHFSKFFVCLLIRLVAVLLEFFIGLL